MDEEEHRMVSRLVAALEKIAQHLENLDINLDLFMGGNGDHLGTDQYHVRTKSE